MSLFYLWDCRKCLLLFAQVAAHGPHPKSGAFFSFLAIRRLSSDCDDRGLEYGQRLKFLLACPRLSLLRTAPPGYLLSPQIAILLFVWMIAYHAATSEGLHANRIARLFARGRLSLPDP